MIISLIPTLNYLIVICISRSLHALAHPLFFFVIRFESFSMNCTFQWKLSLFHNRFHLCATKTIGHHRHSTHNIINSFSSVCECVYATKKIQAVLCHLLRFFLHSTHYTVSSAYPHKSGQAIRNGFSICFFLLARTTKKPLIEFNGRAVIAAENLNCCSIYFLSFELKWPPKKRQQKVKCLPWNYKKYKKNGGWGRAKKTNIREKANSLIKKGRKMIGNTCKVKMTIKIAI